MAVTEIDWAAIEGKAAKDIPDIIKAPAGVWKGSIVSAQYRVEEYESKKNPGEKFESRSCLFEVIPEETVFVADEETAALMSDTDKVESRKWYRIDIRRLGDTTTVKDFLKEMGAFDEDLPLFSRSEKSCLDLVGANGKFAEAQFELTAKVDKNGQPVTHLTSLIVKEPQA